VDKKRVRVKGSFALLIHFPPSEEKNEWVLGQEFALSSSTWAPRLLVQILLVSLIYTNVFLNKNW
jgi:hypothetical protein